MKHAKLKHIVVYFGLLLFIGASSSCNKDVEQFADIAYPTTNGITLLETLKNNPYDSLYLRLVKRGGQESLINDSTKTYTMFVPDNAGMKLFLIAASQGYLNSSSSFDDCSQFISNNFPVEKAAVLVQYNTMPQLIKSTSISNQFPNFYYPSSFNPAPELSPLVRLDIFPTNINGGWVNDVPIKLVDQLAKNGVIHQTATLVMPPPRDSLWAIIDTSSDLKFFKAAVLKADSGVAPAERLQTYFKMFGPNFTVFAPVDSAFKSFLISNIASGISFPGATAIATGVVNTYGVDIISNPSSIPVFGSTIAAVFTAMNVKGIIAYHMLMNRAFKNNFPKTETAYPTLLNSVLTSHPGLKLKAVFNPTLNYPVSETVNDFNSATPVANILSGKNFINGIFYKIDGVMMPQ